MYKLKKFCGRDMLYLNDTFIPFDPDNADYQTYLKWLDEGNTPLPADEVTQWL